MRAEMKFAHAAVLASTLMCLNAQYHNGPPTVPTLELHLYAGAMKRGMPQSFGFENREHKRA